MRCGSALFTWLTLVGALDCARRYSFDALLRQCADERERDELVSELRERCVGVALESS